VKEFRDIEVFAISKNIEFFAILEDAKLSLAIENIKFSTICENVKFLTTLIDSISKEKLFSFITRKCARKRQM